MDITIKRKSKYHHEVIFRNLNQGGYIAFIHSPIPCNHRRSLPITTRNINKIINHFELRYKVKRLDYGNTFPWKWKPKKLKAGCQEFTEKQYLTFMACLYEAKRIMIQEGRL